MRLRRRRVSGLTRRAFHLMAMAPVEGALVEFGVYRGEGLAIIARLARTHLRGSLHILGFDSFEGMPPTERPLTGNLSYDWAKGTFADTDVVVVRERLRREGMQATLVKGVFSDLPPLRTYGVDKVRFVHIDADIYEGYRDALRLLTPAVQVGTVMLFDETVPPADHRYQGIREHGRRAVREWEDETGLNLHLIRFESTAALCVIVDEAYLERYARQINRLRLDTWQDLIRNYAKMLLQR